MKFKKFIVACGLVAIATILCWLGSAKISSKDEPTHRVKKTVILQKEVALISEVPDIAEKLTVEPEVSIEINEEYQEESTTEEVVYYAPEPQPTIEQAVYEPVTEAPAPVETPSGDSNYLGTYKITGYVATGNTCANGNYPTSGYTIASNSLPIGTRVYIEGIGERVVEDRGGMSSNVIDVFVDSTSEAYSLTGDYEVYIVE